MPLPSLRGKITKSCTRVGPMLKNRPRRKMFLSQSGTTNRSPQIPPQTILG